MQYTLQDMIRIVRANCQEPSTKRYTDKDIAAFINSGVLFLGNLTRQFISEKLRVQGICSLAVGVNEYPIPFLAEDFDTAEILNSQSRYKSMRRIYEEDKARYREDDTFNRNRTNHYLVRGRSIHILEQSVPTLASGLRMTFKKLPAQLHYGTISTGGDASAVLDDAAGATGQVWLEDDVYVGESIYIVSGTGAGQIRRITNYVGSTRTITPDSNFSPALGVDSVYTLVSMLPMDLHHLFIQYAEALINRDNAKEQVYSEFLLLVDGLGTRGPQPATVKPWGM